jgi:hypothetical protein
MQCGYCSQFAVARIPATPANVCSTHAIEFWKGLLAFSHECRKAWIPPSVVLQPVRPQRLATR